ncbi:MAG: AEC family transporter [Myxococcota bacterium]
MEPTFASLGRLVALALPVGIGAACGAFGLFSQPREAVAVLNRYALYVGFPALVAAGLLKESAVIPDAPAFWLLWPATLMICLLLARVLRASAPVGLVLTFGNVAYLGLPYVLAVLGPSIAGPAALAVAVHVTGAVTVGPILLARASSQARGSVVGAVLRLPLFWAPIFGLAGRALPAAARAPSLAALEPFSASAAPVALFLLGLHVYVERGRLAEAGRAALSLVGARLLLSPLVALALSMGAVRLGWLDPELARVHVVLASMPVAITTFSMAHDASVQADRVAAAIVASSLIAALTLPLWSAVASAAL